jgi:hypothetical protein
MPEQLARIIATLALPMTSQALADLALQADQERRRALKAGNTARAAELETERDSLTDIFQEQG